ncbi:AraC family transcriptional regulator [Bradyrhizobium sp. SYSU BS000235]|uniref:AraC family transcriptional regulator n=1 Tax=Bradyrhizobium sp. SYSU BS000235 TaxID=3411332 RepID=UPI003C783A52
MYRQNANGGRHHVPSTPVCEGLRILARSYQRGTRLDTHTHREAQLIFAERGVMQVTTPKGRWLVPPARAVWVPPRLGHAIDVLADIEMRTLYAEPEWLAKHPEAPRLIREFVVAVGPLLRESVLALFGDRIHPRRAEVLAELVLYELAEAEDAATFMPMPADARARHVAALVLADPLIERDLDDLALAAGASSRTVTRLFPDETGLTFREWRRRARIMAAAEMLSSGSRPVKNVASRFGFSSVAAFGHAFREVMGMTPGEFQRRSVL